MTCRQSIWVLVMVANGITASATDAVLKPPQGYLGAVRVKNGATEPCATMPPPYTATLDFPSKYEGSDAARDQLNAAAEARYEQLTQPITAMEKGFSKHVGKYMDAGDPAQLECALRWIDGWATAAALEGAATTHTGKSLRKWALASLSGAWLRLEFSASAPLTKYPAQAVRVETWLGDVANRVAREWLPGDPLGKINNHYYWAAWSLMATAVATNRRELFDQSLQIYRVFARQADAEGYLPNELARASQAAGYHNYSMLPLAMIAAFGKANGVDLAAEGDGALTRLAQRAQAALEDPASFQPKTGVTQTPPDADSTTNWSWLEPYCWTVRCSPSLLARRVSLYPLGTTRLGGNLSAVFSGFGPYPKPPALAEPSKP
jgi:poly(beta-D-mannuronate) lyase